MLVDFNAFRGELKQSCREPRTGFVGRTGGGCGCRVQPYLQESKADYKMKQAVEQHQVSLAQPNRQRAWSRCCDKLGKRMVTAMRPVSG